MLIFVYEHVMFYAGFLESVSWVFLLLRLYRCVVGVVLDEVVF
jgi:hypothetical protein